MDDDLPTEYDVIVVGTGLVESVVAAAAARIGKKVLHLDGNSYYGQLWATFNLECFESWLKKVSDRCQVINDKALPMVKQYAIYDTFKEEKSLNNLQWKWFISNDSENLTKEEVVSSTNDLEKNTKAWTISELKKLSQKFNIDLSPKIIFSKGPMVELLIRSGVSRYTEFISVHNVLLYINSVIECVPYSKSDVFSTRSVSVVEKRILMKLLQEIQSYSQESLDNGQVDVNETFNDFLKRFQIPENIKKYILYSIAGVSKNSTCVAGIKAAQFFLNSLGVYGNSPFLWPLYGSSELVQAFCRLCAVYGGIYCLNRGADKILVNDNGCVGILSDNKELLAKYVVLPSTQTPADFFVESTFSETVSRGILITDKSLYSSGKKGASMLQFPSDDPSVPPITIVELDSSTLACPSGLCLVHLIKEGSTKSYEEFDRVIQELFKPCDQEKELLTQDKEEPDENQKPSLLFKSYFSITELGSEPSDIKPKNLFTCTGPVQTELDFFSALKEAENIFRQMYPDEEFLPPPVAEATNEE